MRDRVGSGDGLFRGAFDAEHPHDQPSLASVLAPTRTRKDQNPCAEGARLCFHGITIRKEVVQISSKTFGTLEVASR